MTASLTGAASLTGVRFPLTRPVMPKPEHWLPYLTTSYDRHYFTNFGPNEQLLSRRIAGRFCAPGGEAVLTCNATAALTAALVALGVRGNVAIPAFTFPATLHAVIAAGCRPVLLDVDPVTWELSAEIVAEAMRRCDIHALMPVRVFGFVRDHADLLALAHRQGVPVIFDSAAALGHVRFPISDADQNYVEVFSLHATKSFAVGEGGAILCPPRIARDVRRVLNFGLNADRSFGDGMNAKMSEFQAAVGLAALDMLDPLLERRRQVAAAYTAHFARLDGVALAPDTRFCPWSVYPVLTAAGTDVPEVVSAAAKAGLQLRRYYHPSLERGYCGTMVTPLIPGGDLPVSRRISEGMLCLPVYADMTEAELAWIMPVLTDLFATTAPFAAATATVSRAG